jgi:hypothetical protein
LHHLKNFQFFFFKKNQKELKNSTKSVFLSVNYKYRYRINKNWLNKNKNIYKNKIKKKDEFCIYLETLKNIILPLNYYKKRNLELLYGLLAFQLEILTFLIIILNVVSYLLSFGYT